MREFKMENETTIEVGETYRFADICRLWQILRS